MKRFYQSILLLLFVLCGSTELMAQNRMDSLIVFVGEKLSLDYEKMPVQYDTVMFGLDTLISPVIQLDSRYKAKYKILQLVHGSYEAKTIDFIVYDHYGVPAFSKFNHVLLFVSYHHGKLYHEKYQYFDLYKTKNGKWASPYSSSDYDHPYKENITVKPEKIPFKKDLRFPLRQLSDRSIKFQFPTPYYELKGGYAIPVFGNYVPELFRLTQETVLKSRYNLK